MYIICSKNSKSNIKPVLSVYPIRSFSSILRQTFKVRYIFFISFLNLNHILKATWYIYCGFIYICGYQLSWIEENLQFCGYLSSWFGQSLHTKRIEKMNNNESTVPFFNKFQCKYI